MSAQRSSSTSTTRSSREIARWASAHRVRLEQHDVCVRACARACVPWCLVCLFPCPMRTTSCTRETGGMNGSQLSRGYNDGKPSERVRRTRRVGIITCKLCTCAQCRARASASAAHALTHRADPRVRAYAYVLLLLVPSSDGNIAVIGSYKCFVLKKKHTCTHVHTHRHARETRDRTLPFRSPCTVATTISGHACECVICLRCVPN